MDRHSQYPHVYLFPPSPHFTTLRFLRSVNDKYLRVCPTLLRNVLINIQTPGKCALGLGEHSDSRGAWGWVSTVILVFFLVKVDVVGYYLQEEDARPWTLNFEEDHGH